MQDGKDMIDKLESYKRIYRIDNTRYAKYTFCYLLCFLLSLSDLKQIANKIIMAKIKTNIKYSLI